MKGRITISCCRLDHGVTLQVYPPGFPQNGDPALTSPLSMQSAEGMAHTIQAMVQLTAGNPNIEWDIQPPGWSAGPDGDPTRSRLAAESVNTMLRICRDVYRQAIANCPSRLDVMPGLMAHVPKPLHSTTAAEIDWPETARRAATTEEGSDVARCLLAAFFAGRDAGVQHGKEALPDGVPMLAMEVVDA